MQTPAESEIRTDDDESILLLVERVGVQVAEDAPAGDDGLHEDTNDICDDGLMNC